MLVRSMRVRKESSESSSSSSLEDGIRQTAHTGQDDDSDPTEQIKTKDLSWENLSVTVGTGRSARQKSSAILSNVSGHAPSGQVTCILGHSGSGKSTLLKILGGRHDFFKNKAISFNGVVKINGKNVAPEELLFSKDHGLAFVGQAGQDDSFLESVTPREAIRFSARLRLPRNTTEEYIGTLTKDILLDLKLTRVQDRVISRTNGLSGGEKRRVSLGLELVTHPQVLLLDEITSGLDSHSACVVMDICRQIATKKGTTIAMVIHQPNSIIFSMMDRIVILKDGGCMYEGMAHDVVAQHFADRGFPVPSTYSTPDWLLEVSQDNSREVLMERGFFEMNTADDLNPMLSQSTEKKENLHQEGRKERVTIATEIRELFKREFFIARRDPLPRLKEVGMIFALSLLIGIVFWGVGKNSLDEPEAFASQVGVVFTVIMSCTIMVMTSITSSVNNRSRFCREYVSGHYRLVSYGIVMMVFEVGFIFMCGVVYTLTVFWTVNFNGRFWYFFGIIMVYGAVSSALGFAFTSLFENAEEAQSQVPLAVAPQFLLSGFLATKQSLTPWIRWMIWLQPVTYSFRLALNEEFSTCQEISLYNIFCYSYLETQQATYDDGLILTYWLALLAFLAFYSLGGLLLLRRRAITSQNV